MLPKDAIKQLIQESPTWSQNKLAYHLNMSPMTMSNRMNANDLKAGFIAEILEVLGGQLVILPPGAQLPKDAIKLDPTYERRSNNAGIRAD